MKKYYVEKPDLKPYEGIIVDKNTKLEYKNDMVEQKLENLKFVSKYVKDTKKYLYFVPLILISSVNLWVD